MPNREKLSQTRKVHIGPYPPVMQKNWFITVKAKEAEATVASQAPTPTQPAKIPVAQSPFLPDTKYCAVCTLLGKLCPNEYLITTDWEDDLREEGRKNHNKEDNFSVCSDGMQI